MNKTKIGIEHAILGEEDRGYHFKIVLDSGNEAMDIHGRDHAAKSAALSELRDVLRMLSSNANSEFERVSRLLESHVGRETRAKRKGKMR